MLASQLFIFNKKAYATAKLSYSYKDTGFKLKIYSNKKETSDFHGTVSYDPVKMLKQKYNQNVYQTSDTQKLVIF